MPCNMSRKEVSKIVVDVFCQELEDPTITEDSRFGKEIIMDPIAKSAIYWEIKAAVERPPGCLVKKFSQQKHGQAKTVEDIVNGFWDDFTAAKPKIAAFVTAATKAKSGKKAKVRRRKG